MSSLKTQTARSVQWGAIDRLSSQILYAVTGIVLANVLSPTDFGLVGAVLIFQAFAALFVDSGFSSALIRHKDPTNTDYSTILWFNMGVAILLYIVLYLCAPLIARCFDDDRIIGLSRLMFVSIIINATSIVQANRFIGRMDLRPLTVANIISLTLGGVVGIYLAVAGAGAYAIVWQSLVSAAAKSGILWCWGRWRPQLILSIDSLRAFCRIGSAIMLTSLLNTIFNNIYSFVIGNRAGMAPLGYYTQSDKWSKMGIMSISQTLTSAFVPTLSKLQIDGAYPPQVMPRLRNMCGKMHRATAYIVFPVMIGLVVMAAPIFHTLFGSKWDFSILIFQLLAVRGILMIFTGLYNNYILALGRSRLIVAMEVVRDATALVALLATLPWLGQTQVYDEASASMVYDPVYGIRIMVYGQIVASAVAWVASLVMVQMAAGISWWRPLLESLPYMAITAVSASVAVAIAAYTSMAPLLTLCAQALAMGIIYVAVNALAGSRIQTEIWQFVRHR